MDRRDPRHAAIRPLLKQHEGRLLTSNFVVDETLTLVRTRLGWTYAHALGSELRAGVMTQVVRLRSEDEDEAWSIFVRYRDHVLSFTDCTSFTLMRRLGLTVAIAVDSDFRSFGLECRP